jgi:hypothetical protein
MKNPSQIEMAETLLTELVEEFEGVSEISPLDLLDMLGVCGLSLTIGMDASLEYMSQLSQIAKNLK